MPMKKDNLIYLNNNEIKIEKTGDRYVCSYKLEGLGWIAFKTVKMDNFSLS